jgi:response regulator of citrate/malate metabolism
MIRTLIVEDDFRVAELHQSYTERVLGFTVVGTAATGDEAIQLVRQRLPDLLLLDIYLPDMSGFDVIRHLRQPDHPPVDIIAITAAKEVEALRSAMQGGVINYLVKPFLFATFEQRLRNYALARDRLSRTGETDQGVIDRIYSLLHTPRSDDLPKGLSAATFELILSAMRTCDTPVSAEEIAGRAGVSRVTARRYLDHLTETGQVELRLRYGGPGRPEHRYRMVTPSGTDGATRRRRAP